MNAPRLREAEAYRSIREALAAGWPSANFRDARQLALAVKALTGAAPASVAVALRAVDAVAAGVRAGLWPGAEDIETGRDVVLAALGLALADASAVGMLLQLLATGHAPAQGLGFDEEGSADDCEREEARIADLARGIVSYTIAEAAILVHVDAGWPTADSWLRGRLARAVAHLSGREVYKLALAQHLIDAVADGVRAGVWPSAEDIHVAADLVHGACAAAWQDDNPDTWALLARTLRTGKSGALGVAQ